MQLVLDKINVWREELHAGGPGGDGPAPAPKEAEAPKVAAAAKAAPKVLKADKVGPLHGAVKIARVSHLGGTGRAGKESRSHGAGFSLKH